MIIGISFLRRIIPFNRSLKVAPGGWYTIGIFEKEAELCLKYKKIYDMNYVNDYGDFSMQQSYQNHR